MKKLINVFAILGVVFGLASCKCSNEAPSTNEESDVIATSEVSVSLTINTDKPLEGLKSDLERYASVDIKRGKSIVTIICDVARSSEILQSAFKVLSEEKVNVQMISQGASKVNISFIVDDAEANTVVKALHKVYFGD